MPKGKNNNLITIILSAVIILLLCMLAYLLFFNRKDELKPVDNSSVTEKECNCPKCNECEKCENKIEQCNCADNKSCSTSNKYTDQMIFSKIGMFYVTSKGEVYYEPRYNSYEDYISESDIKNAAKKLLGNQGKYTVTSDIFVESHKHDFDYKLNLNNIRYAIELRFGNGGFNSTIAFVSTDGKISEISYQDGDEKMLFYKNVNGFSNIVAIVPAGEEEGSLAITYDICGNSKDYISPRFKNN